MKRKVFIAVAILEVIAVAADWPALQWLTKPLLAPLLIWYVGERNRLSAALAFAFLGDVALLLDGRPAFLAGMLFFLGAQLCFLTAFLRRARPRVPAFAAYAIVWAAVNALLWSRLGALRLPILIYSLALAAMAAAAVGVSRRTALGGALFLLSDLMIGVGAAGLHLPASGVLIMTTYAAALYLIVTGFAARKPDVAYAHSA
ncbi:lysoplasmalogenase [Actinoplanes oblitus]|uniref:Lysoplasmalogenase n=1 Tax=Actinoplanes oblitus TaxID=3040509 RepID=A0ABY8W8R2_9ACTN|nr:lysoplasmalogenase [Actinoplanes oblitus]WIM94249.1 lysoplasmalogenase [Actinoplanes oblitus]